MPQVINETLLSNLFTAHKASFRNGFQGVTPQWAEIATQVPSSAATETYSWLNAWPRIREWIGDRQVKQLSGESYKISNRDFESTVAVPRNAIEDDQVGLYSPMFQELGRATAAFPDELIFPLLPAGATTKCYDGQYFFDTDHPVAGGVKSNHGGGGGTAWYLLDTTRALKPLIYQTRRSFDLVALDKPTDQNVFNRKEFVYGVDGRANAGYGFWQMAYMSKQTLDATAYEAARAAMMGLTDDEGKPLGIKPNRLVVPGSLEGAARRLLKRSQVAGSDNEWADTAEILVANYL